MSSVFQLPQGRNTASIIGAVEAEAHVEGCFGSRSPTSLLCCTPSARWASTVMPFCCRKLTTVRLTSSLQAAPTVMRLAFSVRGRADVGGGGGGAWMLVRW